MGDSHGIPSYGIGTTSLGASLCVPGLEKPLISTAQDDATGLFTTFGGGTVIVTDQRPITKGRIIRSGTLAHGHYSIDAKARTPPHHHAHASAARISNSTYDTLHSITHYSRYRINRMIKHNMASGLPRAQIPKNGYQPPCGACLEGSMRSPSIPKRPKVGVKPHNSTADSAQHSSRRKYKPFEVVGVDIVDLGRKSKNKRWVSLFHDKSTDKSYVYFSKSKKGFGAEMLTPFIQEVVQPAKATVGAFQCDFDALYWTPTNKARLQAGTTIRRSPPYTQQLNGAVEKRIGTVKDKARVLMGANARFRPWAIRYANTLINYSYTAADRHHSPEENATGIKPDISKLRPFWDTAWAFAPKATRDDTGWSPKGLRCNYLSPSTGTTDSSDVYLTRTKRVVTRWQVRSEHRLPAFRQRAPAQPQQTVASHYEPTADDITSPFDSPSPSQSHVHTHVTIPVSNKISVETSLPSTTSPFPSTSLETTVTSTGGGDSSSSSSSSAPADITVPTPVRSAPNQPRQSDAHVKTWRYVLDKKKSEPIPTRTSTRHRTIPMRLRNDNFAAMIGTRTKSKLHKQLVKAAIHQSIEVDGRPISSRMANKRAKKAQADARVAAIAGEDPDHLPPTPRNIEEANASEHPAEWSKALEVERTAIAEHGTYEPAPNWKGRTVKSKIAYRVTREADGSLKFKARLVAKGFTEKYGVDYFGTFAPTVSTRSLNILLHIAATEDREIMHIDVAGAYLESPIDTELYMQLPLDLTGSAIIVVRLIKAIYGLKQSGELWYKRLHGILVDQGFTRSVSDPCVYIRFNPNDDALHRYPPMYLCIYVDDILCISGSVEEQNQFEQSLMTRVKRIKSEPAAKYIGVDLRRNRPARLIHLSQKPFLREMLASEGMLNATIKNSPGSALRDLQGAARGEAPEMRSRVGKVRYAVDHTRPESLFIASHLSSGASNPGLEHVAASKHLLRFFSGSIDEELTLGGPFLVRLEGWVDAGLVEVGDSKSQLGYCYRLNTFSGMVFSRSMKDSHVSLSSAEAEVRALKELTTEIIWARDLLEELGYNQSLAGTECSATVCFEDNSAAIDMVSSVKLNQRTKHLTKVTNFVRDHIERGTITVKWIPSEDNIADVLTKALPYPLFKKHSISLKGSRLSRSYYANYAKCYAANFHPIRY